MSDHPDVYARTDLYRRFLHAAHRVLEHGQLYHQEVRELDMAEKVNLQDALNSLVVCPVCTAELVTHPGYPAERSCACGDFTITAVWMNGDIEFTFKMNGREPETEGEEAAPHGPE